ncbi:uncharacterized protein LOC115456369 isoform X2 [Manduca sexta]|nr:uncharacterized protein LOC115456369 isoform X2 [Manduca sexta]
MKPTDDSKSSYDFHNNDVYKQPISLIPAGTPPPAYEENVNKNDQRPTKTQQVLLHVENADYVNNTFNEKSFRVGVTDDQQKNISDEKHISFIITYIIITIIIIIIIAVIVIIKFRAINKNQSYKPQAMSLVGKILRETIEHGSQSEELGRIRRSAAESIV